MKWYGYILIIFGVIVLYIALSFFQYYWMGGDNYYRNNMNHTEITAHRGGAAHGIENSLSAIERSLSIGCNSIEIDVHATKDGEVVVCHDPSVDRTTNGKGKIKDMTLAEVKQLNLIDKEGNVSNEKIPTLEEVLMLINGRAELLLEIKPGNGDADIEKKVIDILKKNNAVNTTVIQSFNDRVLENVHAIDPNIPIEKLLFFKFPGLPLIFDGGISTFSAKKYKNVRSFNFYYPGLNKRLANQLHKDGKRIRIWTLDDKSKTPDYFLNGIITDDPDLFLGK